MGPEGALSVQGYRDPGAKNRPVKVVGIEIVQPQGLGEHLGLPSPRLCSECVLMFGRSG